MMAMTSVSTTLSMAAYRKSSEVISVTNSRPAGIVFCMSSQIFLMRALTSVALAPGDWKIIIMAPGLPLMLETKL